MIREGILLVDDEDDLRLSLKEALESDGYTIDDSESASGALAMIGRRHYSVVVTDLNMPGTSGLELIEELKVRDPKTLCIVITGFATLNAAIEALKQGAYDFVQKPFKLEELEAALDRALEHSRLRRQLEDYQHDLETRVVARVSEFHAFHHEVLRLNGLLREALGRTEDSAPWEPFSDYLKARFEPDGMMLLGVVGGAWILKDQWGFPKGPDLDSLPIPAQLTRAWEWNSRRFPDGHLIPFAHGGKTIGAVFLGFASRSPFHPEDPVFQLWRDQMEAVLRLLSRRSSS